LLKPTPPYELRHTHMTSLDIQDTVSTASVSFSLQVLTAVLLKFYSAIWRRATGRPVPDVSQ